MPRARPLHVLRDVERDAFRALFSDAHCLALGRQTRAADVRVEAHALASILGKALATPRPGLRYSSARHAWLLECLAALDVALERARGEQEEIARVRRELTAARAAATTARRSLLVALESAAGNEAAARSELSRARGGARPGQLVASLRGLAALVERWLRVGKTGSAGKTKASHVSARAALFLAPDDHVRAREAADALDLAEQRAAGLRRSGGADAREVNLAEGRVLAELRAALKAFAVAREADPRLPLLTPGPATRRILRGRPKTKPATGR